MLNFVFLAQNLTCRPSVSRRTIREKSFFGQKRKKSGNWATLFRTSGRKFRRVCQSCDVYDQRSFFRQYFFCKNLPFLIPFRSWSRNCHHSWQFISAVSSKLVSAGQSYNLRWSGLFQKVFVFIQNFLASYGNIFFIKISKTGGPNCNLYVQKSNPKNFLNEYFDFLAKDFVRI